MSARKCAYYDICNRYDTESCYFCKYSPNSLTHDDLFLSCKCGLQAEFCANRAYADVCDDCDPFDAPCSLYKYRGFL